MNDIYEVFAEAYKTDSAKNGSTSFTQFNDVESGTPQKPASTKQKVQEKVRKFKSTLFNYEE